MKDKEKDNEEMSAENEESPKKIFKAKIMSILEKNGFNERRPAKCDMDDFLNLLYIFK